MKRWLALLPLFAVSAAGLHAQQRIELPERDTPLRDRPADVWTVGTDEGETWEMLSNVRTGVFDANDNLYALDTGNTRVLVFDRTGKFVRSIGKEGEGPGELQFPNGIGFTPDGKLVIAEPRGFSVFKPTGEFETFIPNNRGMGAMRLGVLFVHPQGGIVTQERNLPAPGETLPEAGSSIPAPIVRLPLTQNAEPELIYPLTEEAPTIREVSRGGGRVARMMTIGPPPTFSRRDRWVMLADGRVAVAPGTPNYEVLIASGGRATHVISRPIRPRTASERDRDRARERLREALESGGGGTRVSISTSGAAAFSSSPPALTPDQINEQVEGMEFAEQVFVIQNLFAGHDGKLWIQRAPNVWGDDSPVDLVAADGRYIGTVSGVQLPLAVSPSGLAAWVERDELDVEKIVVRRLPASWRE